MTEEEVLALSWLREALHQMHEHYSPTHMIERENVPRLLGFTERFHAKPWAGRTRFERDKLFRLALAQGRVLCAAGNDRWDMFVSELPKVLERIDKRLQEESEGGWTW